MLLQFLPINALLASYYNLNMEVHFWHKLCDHVCTELEKGGGSCANFWLVNALKKRFCICLCNFWQFCSFVHNFELLLTIFCVQIVQAQSFASTIL